VLFAVRVEAEATPLPLVETVSVAVPEPANVPLAPAPGAVKVTETPLMGMPDSETVASSAAAKAVPTAVLCGVPAVAVIM
jgi:hypothetical protein